MKAMVAKAPKERLILQDRGKPKPKPQEALIKVKACGVCHN